MASTAASETMPRTPVNASTNGHCQAGSLLLSAGKNQCGSYVAGSIQTKRAVIDLGGIKALDPRSIPIAKTLDAFLLGAMDTAEDSAVVLDPMPDDAAAAMRAGGRESLDSAFEAVEDHGAAAHSDLEALVVVVAALLTSRHGLLPSARFKSQPRSGDGTPADFDAFKMSSYLSFPDSAMNAAPACPIGG